MMRLQFYCGMGVGGTWKQKLVHRGISILSKPATHVELVFSDGLSVSSEFGIGPRIKQIDYTHPERWKVVSLPQIDLESEVRIRRKAEIFEWLRKEGFLGYDTRGALGCTLTGKQDIWKWFCSELVYELIAPHIAIEALNYKMTPQRLFNLMQSLNKM